MIAIQKSIVAQYCELGARCAANLERRQDAHEMFKMLSIYRIAVHISQSKSFSFVEKKVLPYKQRYLYKI